MRAIRLLIVTMVGVGTGCSGAEEEPAAQLGQELSAKTAPVGLSLRFINGQTAPLSLLGHAPRYLQEIDVSESVATTEDAGITPLIEDSAFAELDWSGVRQVEEVWVPSLDGTMTRERYFRGARWMEQPSQLRVVAIDAEGRERGQPWTLNAGSDDRLRQSDDFFVRRFVARQSAFGCAGVGDCGGARFVTEALVQLRDALDARSSAHRVHPAAVALKLSWNRLPSASYEVPVTLDVPEAGDPAYGFEVKLETARPPTNGRFYVPGEQVELRVSFLDGRGQRLHPIGQLPSYGEFVSGQVQSGIRYLDLSVQTRLFYALKHRESNLLAVLSGPTNKLKTPTTVVDPNAFFGPQVPFATVAVDGFTAIGQTVPPAAIIFGGFTDPSLWSLPVSDILRFTIPADAEAGTYVAAIKARREYAGEASNRGATLDISVGQSQPTAFTARTACNGCHSEQKSTSFDRILHGIDDRRSCFGCHASLGIEFDNALDIRVHTIHDRSDRFAGDVSRCSTCHLTRPGGPARGILP